MNNAIRMSTVENGDVENWMPEKRFYTYDDDVEYLNKYILPYISYTDISPCRFTEDETGASIPVASPCIKLSDGTLFSFYVDTNGCDIGFYANGKYTKEKNRKNRFSFQFNKTSLNDNTNKKNFIEPFIYGWNGDIETLKNGYYGCYTDNPVYCTKLIQLNGWEIPNDYPW